MRARLTHLGASEEARSEFERTVEVLSFFGIDPDAQPPAAGGLGAAAKSVSDGPIAKAMKSMQTLGAKPPKFCSPGEVFSLPGVESTRVFVLGPPKDLKQLHKDLPSTGKGAHETYDDNDDHGADAKAFGLGKTIASRSFLASAFGAAAIDPGYAESLATDRLRPFDQKFVVPWEDAKRVEFFLEHYFETGSVEQGQEWRRIDSEWTEGSAAFAMQLDGDTNNTSLALAFELPGGHVLLFPADAQVGNWESWHADSKGVELKFRDEDGKAVDATAEHLLNRVVFYKAGHHGSHNATLKSQGLEMMTRPGLTVAVPVDAYVAHVKKRWTKMPFKPLTDRLNELTKGKGLVVTADCPVPGSSKTVSSDGVKVTVVDSPSLFDDEFDVEHEKKKVKRPLYVDYHIAFV